MLAQSFVKTDHLLVGIEPVLHPAIVLIAIHAVRRLVQHPPQFMVLLRGDVQDLCGQFSQGILPVVQTQNFISDVEGDGCKHGGHLFFVCK